MNNEFTEREVNLFLEGMKFARSLAINTGKGIIASHAITESLQTLSMRKEVAKMKGTWG